MDPAYSCNGAMFTHKQLAQNSNSLPQEEQRNLIAAHDILVDDVHKHRPMTNIGYKSVFIRQTQRQSFSHVIKHHQNTMCCCSETSAKTNNKATRSENSRRTMVNFGLAN